MNTEYNKGTTPPVSSPTPENKGRMIGGAIIVIVGAVLLLHRSGVPVAFHLRILDGMETLLIGTAICEIMNPFFDGGTIFRNVDLDSQSALALAVEASGLSAEGLLEVKVRAFLAGVTADSHKPNAMRY